MSTVRDYVYIYSMIIQISSKPYEQRASVPNWLTAIEATHAHSAHCYTININLPITRLPATTESN